MAKTKEAVLSVPMWIDDVKNLPKFNMTRLSYFVAEVDENIEDWDLLLKATNVPVLIYGLTVAICQPAGINRIFATAKDLDDLFDRFEDEGRFTIETPDIWLPNTVFNKDPVPKRGEVYRVGQKLFGAALRFRSGRTSDAEFIKTCRSLDENALHSPQETRTLQAWSRQQITISREQYQKKYGEDPSLYTKPPGVNP